MKHGGSLLGGSFVGQVIQASVVVGALVAGLYWLGHRDVGAEAASSPPPKPGADQLVPSSPTLGPRQLLPDDAWLAVDFRGDLVGSTPFADEAGPSGDHAGLPQCGQVPAPERVSLAILPPTGDAEPQFFLAAPAVSDDFWLCAQAKVIAAGGKLVAQSATLSVLESPTGILARGPDGSLAFTTDRARAKQLLELVSGQSNESAMAGRHAALLDSLTPGGPSRDGALRATLHLPAGWLDTVGPDAERSPLRHLVAASLVADAEGGATGTLICTEPGCEELRAFLVRAQTDLTAELPHHLAERVGRAVKLEYLSAAPGSPNWGSAAQTTQPAQTTTTQTTQQGRLRFSWDAKEASLLRLLGRFLPSGGLFSPPNP